MTDVAEHTDRAHFIADLETLAAGDSPEWLREIRADATAEFNAMEFPTYRDEIWRRTDIKPILRTTFSSDNDSSTAPSQDDMANYSYAADGFIELVLVDGVFSSDLSSMSNAPDSITITSLAQAIDSDIQGLRTQLNDTAQNTSAFVPLNTAFIQDGTYINIPDNTQIETPIHLLYITTRGGAIATHPRNLVVVGQSSEITLLESYVSIGDTDNYLTNGVTEITLNDNAKVNHHKIVDEGASAYHLFSTQVHEGRDCSYNSFVMTLSGQIVRNELNLTLAGENGNCDLNGLYLNNGDRLIDNALFVEHAVSKCYSRMGYKGVLDDNSASVFTGKVVVPPNSQQTDSDQLNNNLLLSDNATIDTNPQLEIFADDVKCTHGATIGGFPPELVFYFQSRGMDAATADGILTYGFATEVVDAIKIDALRTRLSDYVFKKYSPK
jgi:Fe-S cluster assembly protein SufD